MQIATDISAGGAVAPEAPLDGIELSEGGDLQVDVVSTVDGLEALAPEWRALQNLSHASAVFQSHAHVRLWARHFARRKDGSRLHVAVVRNRSRPVLILPLAVSRLPGLRIAHMAGDPVAQYSDVLLDPSCASRGTFEAALVSLRKAGVDAVVFRRVRDDAHILRLAAPYLRPPMSRKAAPFADLSGFTDFPAFLRSLSKKMRQSLRNRRHHLEKARAFSFEAFRGGAEARAAVADAIDLKRKWLVQRGNLSSAFLDPATRDCLLDLAESAEGGSLVTRLVIDDEVAAIRFGFEYCGTHFAYMSAYDARFADISPGKLLMECVIAGFKERGLQRVDMLAPAGRHKSDWCKEEIGLADYTLPLTRAGRTYAELYQERLRPALKRTFERLPAPLRSLAAALFVNI